PENLKDNQIVKTEKGNVHRYIYYHCTKRKNPNCTQKCIEQKELEKQIKKAIDEVSIPPELHDFGLEWLRNENKKESQITHNILDNQQKGYKDCLKKLSGLIDMRGAGEINKEEFKLRKLPFAAEKQRWEGVLNKTSQKVDRWLDKADEVFDFARDAQVIFEKDGADKKKEIFSRLDSNLLLKDRKITIETESTLVPIKAISKEDKRLEPLKIGKYKAELVELYSKSPKMLRG
ncbi:MAG TPA: zinc ribbon domain-containing protein, partial [Candidatus Pacearchaeota archaeon]|nr:zinc ribbon domain-containing protein [Candidatus Pacearchaeota archaeon]